MRKDCPGQARRWVLALACLLGVPGFLQAQQKDEPARLLVSYDLKKPPTAVKSIQLRANTEQPVHFFLENPGPDTRKDLTVKLFKVLPGGATELLGQAKVASLKVDARERLIFGKPGPIPTDPKAPGLPALDGPPFQFQVWIEEGKNDPVKIAFGVRVKEPREYVEVTSREYDPERRRIRVTVKALPAFTGPPCHVRLALPEDANPGINLKKAQGAFKQTLTAAGEEVELIAEGITFDGDPPKTGRVYVAVDEYERAFGYKNTFNKGSLEPLAEGTRVRAYGQRYAGADGKFPLRLEIDSPPKQPVFVDVGLDRAGNGSFDSKLLRGSRSESILVHLAGTDGSPVFKTAFADWQVDLDTKGVRGARQFRVQLFTVENGEKGNLVPLTDEQTGEEAHPLFSKAAAGPYSLLTFDSTSKSAIFGALIIDDTPPEVAFDGLPKRHFKSKPLVVKATAFDDLSGIAKVVFFADKMVDGKLPPGVEVIVGGKVDKKDLWTATLPLPDSAKDRISVSVQAFNGAGLSTTVTIPIDLVGEPVASKKGGATIKGVVREGARPQMNVPVTLRDDKGKPKATVKTNDKGEYVFENIPPGDYRVMAARSASMTRGQLAVNVPEGKDEVVVDIKLTR